MRCPCFLAIPGLALVATLFTGCAMKVAPTGGPPDREPASVRSITPPSGSRNLVDPEFTVMFDDYVGQDIRNEVSVLPKARVRTSYGGNEINITFAETLKANTTYSITIGTNWRDLRGNSPNEAVTIIFSTGMEIDSGSVSGSIDGDGMLNVVVLAFPGADTLGSTFNSMRDQAPYQIPVGNLGTFRLGGLADGLYRLVAVRDANRNGLPDGNEEYGMASNDVRVGQGASALARIALGPSPAAQITDSASAATQKDSTADTARRPGSVTGTFETGKADAGPFVLRLLDTKGHVRVSLPVVSGQPWTIDTIAPGTYSVDVFADADGDGVYRHGTHFPFRHAEVRYPTQVTVSVRERWTTEDVRITIGSGP